MALGHRDADILFTALPGFKIRAPGLISVFLCDSATCVTEGAPPAVEPAILSGRKVVVRADPVMAGEDAGLSRNSGIVRSKRFRTQVVAPSFPVVKPAPRQSGLSRWFQ